MNLSVKELENILNAEIDKTIDEEIENIRNRMRKNTFNEEQEKC